MVKLTRTILTAFICAIFCSLCVAATAWADETGPIGASGKWVPGTYEDGTVAVQDAHPGMTASAAASFSNIPPRDAYYSLNVVTAWYASEDGVTNWTPVSGGSILNITLPDEGEAGYEDVVNHYLKAVVTNTYVLTPYYTSTGELGNVSMVAESEPVYVKPHAQSGTWATDGTEHWLACSNGPDSQCPHRINAAECQLASDDQWVVELDNHWKHCTVCGGEYGPEKHCFDQYILSFIEENPMNILGSTVHPTCDICQQEVTMRTDYFLENFVIPSGLIGSDELFGNEETPDDDAQEEPAPGATDPEANAADGEDQPAPADDSKANAGQATFARTNDATPASLLTATILAAGAIALFARRRMAA